MELDNKHESKWLTVACYQKSVHSSVQFSLFMHPDQAQNTLSGIQGQEATAVAVIYVTAPTQLFCQQNSSFERI